MNSTGDGSDSSAGDGICDIGGGVCTLRAAIEEANANAGADSIQFAIGTGFQTIAPASQLPAISEQVTIDGTTQPGYAGMPRIEIDGIGAGGPSAFGLQVLTAATGSTVTGLAVNRFTGDGIRVDANNVTISHCIIGTDETGALNRGNGGDGIAIWGSSSQIRQNIVAFNGVNGVAVYENPTTPPIYPLFPLPADVTTRVQTVSFEDNCGVFKHTGGPAILDGLGHPFNENFGMSLISTMTIAVAGDYTFTFTQLDDQGRLVIDTDPKMNVSGPGPHPVTVTLSSGDHAFEIDFFEGGGAASLVLDISGPSTPAFNIDGDSGFQTQLFHARIPAENNTISQNSIFNNTAQGIALSCCCVDTNDAGDIDLGPNTFLNYPQFVSFFNNPNGSVTVSGTAPPNAIVEVFGSTNDGNPSQNHGEGKLFLTAVTADGSGNFSATLTVPSPFYSVTATATDAAGNTSEFSQNFQVQARSISVTSLGDSSPGSLRAAIDDANSDGVESLITFHPSLSGMFITLNSPLPTLTDNATTINGDMNGDCKPDIELRGAPGVSNALTIHSGWNVIRGLALNGFNSEKVLIEGPPAVNNAVVCNYLGTDVHGTTADGGSTYGLLVRNGAANTAIGRPGERNLFVDFQTAIRVEGSNNSSIVDNIIGLDATGSVPLSSFGRANGIQLVNSNFTTIGSNGSGNRIVTDVHGIDVQGGDHTNIVFNTIGWPAGTTPPQGVGIRFTNGARNSTVVENRIENNGGSGIVLDGDGSDSISINRNAISGNGGLGIDLDADGVTPNDGSSDPDNRANNGLNFPVITSATTNGTGTTVSGFLDTALPFTYTIEFFSSSGRDPSGYGEGAAYLGSISSVPTSFTANLPPVPVGAWITATTSDGAGNTSEFSLASQVTGPAAGATNLVAYPVRPNAAQLQWRDPQGSETGFRIESSFNGGAGWSTVTIVGPDVTTYTDTNLPPWSISVHYRVIAFTAAGDAPPSNLALVTTFSTAAPMVCRTTVNDSHRKATAPTAAAGSDGTNPRWAVAWADEQGGRASDIYMQFLNANDGTAIGSPLQITNDDVPSMNPTLVWNGSNYGLLWFDHLRQPNGEMKSEFSFALLDRDGNKTRGDLKMRSTVAEGLFNPDGQMSLVWDGSGWGIFLLRQRTGQPTYVYYRLSSTGDVIVDGSTVIQSNLYKSSISAAWNPLGSEYLATWVMADNSGFHVRAQRLLTDGTRIGAALSMGDGSAVVNSAGTSTIWDGDGWAIAWAFREQSGDSVVYLRRFNPDGTPRGAAVRISDAGSVNDETPKLVARPGGGYFIFTTSSNVPPGSTEIARLEADGSGNRVGSRSIVSTPDGFASTRASVAGDGSSFLLTWEELGTGQAEVADVVVSSAGSPGTIRNLTASHTPPRASSWPTVLPFQNGFINIWNETYFNSGQVHARLYRANGTYVDKKPLNAKNAVGRPSAVTSGSQWAVAWIDDSPRTLWFDRYDSNGTSLTGGGPQQITTNVDTSKGVGVAYSGALWGVVWVDGGQLTFQRVDGSGPVGYPVQVAPGAYANPQIQWVGSGWALLWSSGTSLKYARLDPTGALVVPPTPAVMSTGNSFNEFQMLWTGTELGAVWSENYGPGIDADTFFATLDTDGFKKFPPVALAYGPEAERYASLYFDGDHYHVVYRNPSAGLREIGVMPNGTILPGGRFLGNHGDGPVAIAYNGFSDAMAWGHDGNIYFQTGRCLEDTTPPACPTLNGSFTTSVQLTWPAASDAESGILAYNLYRDGKLLTELLPATGSFTDGGFTPGAVHNYELRPLNGAYLEPGGCTPKSVTAGSGTCPATIIVPTVLPDAVANTAYSQVLGVQNTSSGATFALKSGALPAGLTLVSNGTLSGTPTATGSFSFAISATEPNGCTTTQSYAFSVIAGTAARDVMAFAQSSTSILVQWVRPLHGETGFRVERSVNGTTWSSIVIVASDVTAHVDSNLTPGTLYYYRVIAFSGAGDSGASNIASATTHSAAAAKVCQQPIGEYHARAQFLSLAHDGTRWAAAWSDRRDGKLEDIYFQFLDNTTGAPAGSPVQVTRSDMVTRFPMLRWNGSRFGILYSEHMRGPAGEVNSTTNFALLSSAGALIRSGVRVHNALGGGSVNGGLDLPFVWDGGGWGTFSSEGASNPPGDVYYWRLSPSGDVVTGPVQLTNSAGMERDITVAWDGSQYGLAWVETQGTVHKLWFQRMQSGGTLVGSPVQLDQSVLGGESLEAPNLVWNGAASEWALAWMSYSAESIIRLRRLNPDGSPKGAAVRISDDPSSNLQTPVDDEVPQLMPKSGGGYFVFTGSFDYTLRTFEAARLQADAAGNRTGARVLLTLPGDGFGLNTLRAATDGTRFMLGFESNGFSTAEVANLIVDASGSVIAGPANLTTGHSGGSSGNTAIIPFESGFVTLWHETPSNGTSQLFAKAWDSSGNQRFMKTPLSTSTGTRSRVAAGALGSTFCVVWRDQSSLRFGRYDGNGNPVISEVALPSGGNLPALAWSGEAWGLTFFEGNQLRFQRLTIDGATIGPKVFVSFGQSGVLPVIQWVGSGWAVVWRMNDNLYYALIDRNGAYAVPPVQFTSTTTLENGVQMAWSGQKLGVVWSEDRAGLPPGNDIYFTVLNADGTKAFVEKAIVSTPYLDSSPTIYWDADRFRVVYTSGESGTREMAVQIDGTVIPGDRLLEIRQPGILTAWNGATLGMLYNDQFDLTFQTSACLDDATAPPCPNLGASFDGLKAHLTWPAVSDSGSGIAGYNIYRDGAQLAELFATTLQFDDYGFVSGATHVYELRAINGSNRESSGCTTRTLVAGIAVNPATLPDSNTGSNYNQTLTGAQGTPPYTFAVTAGSLPPGLSLNGSTGVISGSPNTGGMHTFTISATDSSTPSPRNGSRIYTIRICSNLFVYPTLFAAGYVGSAYSQTVFVTGATNNAAVSFSLTGTLPPGLVMDSTGWIHGAPTTIGGYDFSVTATDAIGCTSVRSGHIDVLSGTAVRTLSAFALGPSSIRLRWNDPQRNETGFRIERSLDLGATWAPVAIVGADATTWSDVSLTAATLYSYRVVALGPAGDAQPSPVGSAQTAPAAAARVCSEQLVPTLHSLARSPSVVFTGTQWAMVYTDRTSTTADEVYFTFLTTSGVPTGTPVRITTNDTSSIRPMMKWNGSKFGVMWFENLRGPQGQMSGAYRFALLDATGAVIRRDVRIPVPEEVGSPHMDAQFLWDGSGWGFIEPHMTSDGVFDMFFYRLDEDGDPIVGPVRLTTSADLDTTGALAWNGSEYGMAWERFRDTTTTILFQRFSQSGTMLGAPTAIAGPTHDSARHPDVVATATGWTVFWTGTSDGNNLKIYLRRLDSSGTPLAAAQPVSDDYDLNGFTPADQRVVNDQYPDAYLLPGGGYAVLTRTRPAATNGTEVGFLRADASGNRIGSRVIISPFDNYQSGFTRAAFDGTNLLVAFNEHRLGTQEIASVIVNQTGGTVAGPTDMTTGHSPGNSIGVSGSSSPQIAAVGSGFVALWNEVVNGPDTQAWARIYDGNGAVVATKTPISTHSTRGRLAVVSAGPTFATAWKDTANNIVFGRYDASGNQLAEANVATNAGGSANIAVGFDGANFGVLWYQGGRLNFQRVAPNGTPIAPLSRLAPSVGGPSQQMVWTGYGWALGFVSDNDVYYALLDINGAMLVPPMRVTFTPAESKEGLAIAWNGDALGMAWATRPSIDPPGLVIDFSVVSLDGIKQFPERQFSEGRLDNTLQGLNWNGTRFQVAFLPGEFGVLREQDISAAGELLGSSRLLAKNGSGAAVVWNGVTAAVAWNQSAEVQFETTACLADTTPPACPVTSVSRSTAGVTLTWTPATDAESAIGEYLVYRDNLLIGQTLPTTSQFQDAGIAPSETASYRVTAANKAYLESPSCVSMTPLAIPTGLVAATSSPTQVQIDWSAVAGADHYVVERKSVGGAFIAVGNPTTNTFIDTVSAGSAYLYRVRAANGATTSEASAFDLATTIAFTDDPVAPGIVVKAVHLAEVRQAAAAVRALAGASAPSWTGSASIGTVILSTHVMEARTYINAARTALGLAAVTFTDSIGAGTPIRAVHMQELRNAVK